jgi:hypothetical protein
MSTIGLNNKPICYIRHDTYHTLRFSVELHSECDLWQYLALEEEFYAFLGQKGRYGDLLRLGRAILSVPWTLPRGVGCLSDIAFQPRAGCSS